MAHERFSAIWRIGEVEQRLRNGVPTPPAHRSPLPRRPFAIAVVVLAIALVAFTVWVFSLPTPVTTPPG